MTRAELVKERAGLEAQLGKLGPRHDGLIGEAMERVRALERDVEAARRTVGEAVGAKSEVCGPLESRLLGIDGQLRRSVPAGVLEGLRDWLDAVYSRLQHTGAEVSYTFERPNGLGTASVQRIHSTSQPSLGRAIQAVLAAQRGVADLVLEADVEAGAARIRAEVQAALDGIKVERVEGPTRADSFLDMAAGVVAGLRG